MDLITLADLPALSGSELKPKATVAIGRLDSNLRDPRYGRFSITQADVDSWKRNLAGVFGGEVSFDFDHSSDRGSGTKAAAWVSNISQTGTKEGSLITAEMQFTRAGAQAVRDGDYKYLSPTFVENYTDEHGQKHGKTLIGGAFTNRPVLRKGMPTLSLSADTFDGVAVPAGEGAGAKRERKRARRQLAKVLSTVGEPSRDSRARMDLAELAKQLGLPAGADHVTILAAVAAIKPGEPAKTPAAKPEPVTLDAAGKAKAERKAAKKARKLARPREDGSMALSADGYAELLAKANLGEAASHQLAEQTFTVAWDKALSEGRAAPSQEDNMRALYRENPELAVKTLDSFVRIVPVKPTGSGEGAPVGPAPAGMDEDRFQLHTEAKQLAKQLARDNPDVPPDELYAMAAIQIDDRRNGTSDGDF